MPSLAANPVHKIIDQAICAWKPGGAFPTKLVLNKKQRMIMQ